MRITTQGLASTVERFRDVAPNEQAKSASDRTTYTTKRFTLPTYAGYCPPVRSIHGVRSEPRGRGTRPAHAAPTYPVIATGSWLSVFTVDSAAVGCPEQSQSRFQVIAPVLNVSSTNPQRK